MPAKSGVAGGIMAVLPGQFGLGVFSPPLDAKGNSVRGIEACRRVSKDFSLHLFQVARATSATVVRQVYGCTKAASRRRRGAAEQEVLAAAGDRVRVYELQGELLIGSAESVTLDMLSALGDVTYLIVDLKRVVALDEASTRILVELCPRMAEQGKWLFFTDCNHLYHFRKRVARQVGVSQQPDWLHFADTDHALEWCEDQLIAAARPELAGHPDAMDLSRHYLCAGMTPDEIETLQRQATWREFAAGTRVFRAGDPGDTLYFILRGEVEISVDTETRRTLRLATLGPAMAFGELALLNQRPRTANVLATADTACLEVRLTDLDATLTTKMLVNMAGYFATLIEHDTRLIRQLG
jgi:glutaminase